MNLDTIHELFLDGSIQAAFSLLKEYQSSQSDSLELMILEWEMKLFLGHYSELQERISSDLKKFRKDNRSVSEPKNSGIQNKKLTLEGLDGLEEEWQELLIGLQKRQQLMTDSEPSWFDPPSIHLQYRWKAIQNLRKKKYRKAQEQLDRADMRVPELTGFLDGSGFTELRDSDDRFASILEVLLGDSYLWIEWEKIHKIRLLPANNLRDRYVRPILLELHNRQSYEGWLPLLYPDSQNHDNSLVVIGEMCEWDAHPAGPIFCWGCKQLNIDSELYPFADITQLEFRPQLAPIAQ